MRMLTFAGRNAREILRDPLNLAFGLGFPLVLLLLLSAIQANVPVPLFEIAHLAPGIPIFGLLALLCFNMTMPLTLYALWRRFPEYPGTVFGSLTLALFLGFLPSCFGVNIPIGGVFGSILSLLLLWKAVDDG